MKNVMIPELNRVYNCFDDGKIRMSRLYTVTIKEVIPFDKIDEETLSWWKEEVISCYWLYRKDTDFFIKALDVEGGEQVFVRTLSNGWFSMGFLIAGELDIDGTLIELLNQRMKQK